MGNDQSQPIKEDEQELVDLMRDDENVSIDDLSIANPRPQEMSNVQEKTKQVNNLLEHKEGPKDLVDGSHTLSNGSVFV